VCLLTKKEHYGGSLQLSKTISHIRKLQRNLFLETLKAIWWRHRNPSLEELYIEEGEELKEDTSLISQQAFRA